MGSKKKRKYAKKKIYVVLVWKETWYSDLKKMSESATRQKDFFKLNTKKKNAYQIKATHLGSVG